MNEVGFSIECVGSNDLARHDHEAIVAMCELAYGEELAGLFAAYGPATHLIGRRDKVIVSHAMWVTRWLQPADLPALRTAYIEMVASHPDYQSLGHATRLMAQVPERVADNFELSALCPADTSLYQRLGWTFWRGPLLIRQGETLVPTPEER